MKRARSQPRSLTVFLILSFLGHAALLTLLVSNSDAPGKGPIMVTLFLASSSAVSENRAAAQPVLSALPTKQSEPPVAAQKVVPVRQSVPPRQLQQPRRSVPITQPSPAPEPTSVAVAKGSVDDLAIPQVDLSNSGQLDQPEEPVSEPAGNGVAGGTSPAEEADTSPPFKAAFGTLNGPKVLEFPTPEYPLRARRLGLEGRVLVRLELNQAGILQKASIEKAAGHGFDASALKAVHRARFAPAKRNGQAVACIALLPIIFKLKS